MRILYLYAELMGYTMATVQALKAKGCEVTIVHWDKKKLTPYTAPMLEGVKMHDRSRLDALQMVALADRLEPEITVVSGWQDRGYLEVARTLRKRGRVVVTGLDGQWHGTFRQQLASLACRFGYLARNFSHAWVAGPYQYQYAVNLGFKKENIVFDLYTADLNRFHGIYSKRSINERARYPRRFLFAGRFSPVKGIDTLLSAWRALEGERREWELHLVGNGELRDRLASVEGIVVKDFMQPDELIFEARDAGCFVLPSHHEPWGVVAHEFAAAGLPLILSDAVGSGASFLIPGLNGYSFRTGNAQSLGTALKGIIASSEADLIEMSAASHSISKRISPQTSAANLLATVGR
jgi:glycosyltransferase involved in cell wall biosynthesis